MGSPTSTFSSLRWREAQAGETAFWESHSRLITSNAYRARIETRGLRLARWLARHDKGQYRTALEIGGGGTQLLDFFEIPVRLAVDPLAGFYKQAFGSVLNPSVRMASARGEELPFRSNSFDMVLCRNVLDHVERPRAVIGELLRVVAPGGLLYMAVNTFSGPLLVYRRLHPAIEEPHPFSTAGFLRLFARPDLEELSRRIDNPEEMEHYDDATRTRSLRSFIRERLVGCRCLHFVELMLRKRSSVSEPGTRG